MQLFERFRAERFGPADASYAMVSLPLSRELAGRVEPDAAHVAGVPVGWWRRRETPRRMVYYVLGENSGAAPDALTLRAATPPADGRPIGWVGAPRPGASATGWTARTVITREKLDFKKLAYAKMTVDDLRGIPAEDCTMVEHALELSFGGRTLRIQPAVTDPDGGGTYHWQNVQIDRLWTQDAAEGLRVGGVMYNGDTYLWADLYLVLMANGVADARLHWVNTRLHIEGYDFQGLPLVRFSGEGMPTLDATLPADGDRFDLGPARLNLANASGLCSAEYPGRLESDPEQTGDVFWRPFSRTFNPQKPDAPEREWPVGFARTTQFQFSLSEAVPAGARYQVPNWWYGVSGERGPDCLLPVDGRFSPLSEMTADHLLSVSSRGRFDDGSATMGNDGEMGMGVLTAAQHTGRHDLYREALRYCDYWADIAVDHNDFTVHQWVGGWPWKTCAYTKFRDILAGFLETGDPYLLDTVEAVAETYYTWFRVNWPRDSIGRDAFEVQAMALLWRYLDSERHKERCVEMVRMLRTVLNNRGMIGGQMGAGPHPGFHSSLYMTGVVMISMLEVAESQQAMLKQPVITDIPEMLGVLGSRYIREDIELFPSNYGSPNRLTHEESVVWVTMGCRIFPQWAKMADGADHPALRQGLHNIRELDEPRDLKAWAQGGRPGNHMVHTLYHDALLAGARWEDDGVVFTPHLGLSLWPAKQVVATPAGPLTVTLTPGEAGQGPTIRFEADETFPVTLALGAWRERTDSQGQLQAPAQTTTGAA